MALKLHIAILNTFMDENNIPYVLTGTSALAVHGLLPDDYKPHDIDIIITADECGSEFDDSKFNEVVKKLTSLQKLSGLNDTNYTNSKTKVFTFNVAKMTVNALVSKNARLYGHENYIGAFEEKGTYTRILIGDECVKVSSAMDVLKAKFGLKRNKDYKFAKDLISTILNL